MRAPRFSRRHAVKLGLGSLAALGAQTPVSGAPEAAPGARIARAVLTPADKFEDVSRGNPKPFTLRGDALLNARLTPETWRLEINVDDALREPVTQKPQIGKAL